jgi:tetratricopeptide (TPR) repeat protein
MVTSIPADRPTEVMASARPSPSPRPAPRAHPLVTVSVVALAVLTFACASRRGSTGGARVTADELLAGTALGSPSGPSAADVAPGDVLAVSAEMNAFLDRHVDRTAAGPLKLRLLVAAIVDTDAFGLTYDDTTRTAAETFHNRRGNCLSFSNMLVAMARELGLDAQFQEVDIPPDWTLDKDTYVLNQHVNVHVDLGPAGMKIVDFNIGDFKASYEMRRIADARALAHYYNNIGVVRMQAGDTFAALSCFRRAIADSDRQFSPAWTNLGTLYLRNGHTAHAEAAYLQALDVAPSDLVAMSDLARLYERLGDPQRAAAFREQLVYHRKLNPYYRYELGRQEYAAHHYDEAIGHLKYAIRKRPKEDQFYFTLGLCYYQKGDMQAAQRWLARAQEVAATDPVKRRYASKIDNLLRANPGTNH